MPKKINKKKQSKAKKTKNKKAPKKETTKKKTSKEEILEEAAEEELEEEIKEIDEEIEEKENGEKEAGTKETKKKKAEKTEKEPKKILGSFSSQETAVFIGEAAVAFIALILIGVLLFSGNLFRRSQKPPIPTAVPTDDGSRSGQTENKADISGTNSPKHDQKEEYAEAKKINSSNWATYTNKYYGFELKYPPDWNKVVAKNPIRGSMWAVRYQFRKKNQEEGSPYAGFNVTVYKVKTVKEIKNTEEFPTPKEGTDPDTESCQTIPGHLEENPNYPNEEIFIPSGDDCYNSALFYTVTRDDYIYNISPAFAEGFDKPDEPKKQALEKFPEFFEAATSLRLINIVRPKPQPAAPKITAPMPVSAKKVNGKLVCAKKNDHPRKSKQHKGKHLDMECCLDPDEYPNPWCTY